MNNMRAGFIFWTIAVGATSPLSALAWAADPTSSAAPVAVGYEEQVVTTPVTVENIDKTSRTLTVRTADGQRTTVHVAPDVERFDKLKKGDKIDLAYHRALAVSVVPAQPAGSTNGQTHQMTATPARVVSVNQRDSSMQVRGDNGKTETVAPADDDIRKQMQTLKPGDVVDLIYTEAEATSILPSSSK